jgi:uncharacterized protein (TIGR00269 family)
MRCRRCGSQAALNMRQHKLALCEKHYPEWFLEQTERTIRKHHMLEPGSRVLVAVSGGKDSLALWDVLRRLGYDADGLYIDLGIEHYSTRSREKAQRFADSLEGADLLTVDIEAEYGQSMPEAARLVQRGRAKPCSVCGLIKRHEMNRVACEAGYDVLATGHNLDDEAAVLFGNVLNWQTGYIARQSPVLPQRADGLARKVKPLCRFYERETAAYALIRQIDYIYEECPHSAGATSLRHKEVLNRMETRSPGTKQQFYLGFLRAHKRGFFAPQVDDAELHPCESCGQPTTAPSQCAFCRLWQAATARKDVPTR